MKNLLRGIALIVLMFFCCENTHAQNIIENNPATTKTETPAESSSKIPAKTAKLIRGDGINA